jgi:hypothetical protein
VGVEDFFEAAKNVWTFFITYRAGLVDAVGTEQALAWDNKIHEIVGTNMGQTLKEQAGGKDLNIQEATELVKGFLGSIGVSFQVLEESPTMVRFKQSQCAVYEGSRRAGLDELPIETMCRYGPVKFMGALVKQLNPNLNYQLIKYRSAPDDFCEEAIVLRSPKEEEKRQMWRKGDRKPPFF